jgi:hypothetical protein
VNIYGRDGKPMSPEAFAAVPHKKRVLKQNTLILNKEPVSVLTMWDGMDMSGGESPVPLPFSTYIHSEHYPNVLTAYRNEKHALFGHDVAMSFVRSQGGKGGWRIPAYFLARGWSWPRSVKQGWANVALAGFVLALQLFTLTMSAITWNWDWVDLLPALVAVLYGWWLKNAVIGLRGKLRERDEERRTEKERTEFENIVGPLR